MGKQAVDGGIWVPKSQGSSGSAGEGADREIPNPLRRNQGTKVNQVVSVDAEMGEFDAGKVEYRVESPDTAVEVESKMDDVQLKAVAAVKKRNVEGLLTGRTNWRWSGGRRC
ncbi:uncharacterized protein LOC123446473 [Hordeum vulgare subsp. vulgare]|uniref:uncharacterized protein LOC123446473 n=1 Tax=Hordeum vulgare subsp. vulgare TaxID=112509 RepID=UPI001D1A4CE4|nr:uncharacterized protein LOC123446473 [Hordeum vulgare subsp. vulgare]